MSILYCGNRRNGNSGKSSMVLIWKCIKQMKNSFGHELSMLLRWEMFLSGGSYKKSVTRTLIRCKSFGAFFILTSFVGNYLNQAVLSEFHHILCLLQILPHSVNMKIPSLCNKSKFWFTHEISSKIILYHIS